MLTYSTLISAYKRGMLFFTLVFTHHIFNVAENISYSLVFDHSPVDTFLFFYVLYLEKGKKTYLVVHEL